MFATATVLMAFLPQMRLEHNSEKLSKKYRCWFFRNMMLTISVVKLESIFATLNKWQFKQILIKNKSISKSFQHFLIIILI